MRYENYSYDNNGFDGCGKSLAWLVGIIALFLLIFGEPLFFADDLYVTDEKAALYIEDMTDAESVTIINDDGNSNFFVHDMSDVTFDVYLNFADRPRVRSQFRCTDGFWRDLICRGYDGE